MPICTSSVKYASPLKKYLFQLQLISTCLSRIFSLDPENLPQVSVIENKGNVSNVSFIRWVGFQERATNITAQILVFLLESILPIYHQPFSTKREQQASLLKYWFGSLPGLILPLTHQSLDSKNLLLYPLGMVSKGVILGTLGRNQGWEASHIRRFFSYQLRFKQLGSIMSLYHRNILLKIPEYEIWGIPVGR